MKGKRWTYTSLFPLCLGLLISLFCTFCLTKTASAFTFGNTGQAPVAGVIVYGDKGGNAINYQSYVPQLNSNYKITVSPSGGVNTATNITRIVLDIGSSTIPAYSLFTFTVRYSGQNLAFAAENTDSSWIILNKSCTNLGTHDITNGSVVDDVYCTYWGYTGANPQTSVIMLFGRWYFPVLGSGDIYVPTAVGYTRIYDESGGTSDGLTEEELNGVFRTWLDGRLSQLYTNGAGELSALNQIQLLLQTQNSSNAEIKEAVDDLVDAEQARQEQDQQDRDNLEQQQTETENSANDSAESVSSTLSPLSVNVNNIFSVIRDTPASDCKIPVNVGHGLDMKDMDFCQMPSEMRSLIHNIVTIVVTLTIFWVSMSLIRVILGMVERFVSGGY